MTTGAEMTTAVPGWLEAFSPLADAPRSRDPLGFPGYKQLLTRAAERSATDESVVCGQALVGGYRVVAICFQFAFIGGSMGEATGQRIVAAIDIAATKRLPLITLTVSGGARMQEGMRSLIQMQRVAAALVRLRASGAAHLAVVEHPTTGGVWASLAAAADVILAGRGATIAFAGDRVRDNTEASDAFSASGKLASGAVDQVVDDADVPNAVARYVRALAAPRPSPIRACQPPSALPGATTFAEGWEAVRAARDPRRPRADAYLTHYFEDTVELAGDRAGGRDDGMRCGLGLKNGSAVAFIAQRGTANTPAGFRTATRVLRLAEQWGFPLLTLIDTPGAANDALAEQQGVGTAIAQTFAAFGAARVPVTSVLIGEGGSGGALAIGAPENLWAVPSSYFSVIAPEGAAAILYRDRNRAAEAAELLLLSSADLVELDVIRGIVSIPPALETPGELS